MRFLRTAPTGRLLATLAAVVLVIGGGSAIAVAATSAGPVPPRTPLASAVHRALAAPHVAGVSADIHFTNNLVDSSDFAGQANVDPVLQGASGRLWLAADGRLRLELQSDNGDAQVVVGHGRFWISDPSSHTTYEGTLPRHMGGEPHHGIPSVADIQHALTRLARHVQLSGAQPADVAGRPAYRVTVSPHHDGGLLGSASLAWDAARGVPLSLAIYARSNPTPVLALQATRISYGAIPDSTLDVTPPAGNKVVTLSSPHGRGGATGAHRHSREIAGAAAVARRLPFALRAPRTLVGLPRHAVRLLDDGHDGHDGHGHGASALIAYGQNLGGMAVIESPADGGSASRASSGSGSGSGSRDGLSLPRVSIHGATGEELSTPLGTVLRFTRDGVAYTVIGSVPPAAAEMAARAL